MRVRVDGRLPYIFVNAVKTLTSDVSASLFYRVRFQDGVHTSVGSALYSTHQNHIDREGLRLNFE